jgi:hypothetical protein
VLRNKRAPSKYALLPRQPLIVRYESATPLIRSTTVLPTIEPPFNPLQYPSIARSRVIEITYGLQTYKTRDVQTLSNEIDPTYKAWSI